MRKKRGELLVSNVVFIILNVVFIAILAVFIFRQGGGVVHLEESYAKQIALALDSARPGMKITIDMLDGKKADEEWFGENYSEAVKVVGNVVTVKLSEDSGYSYSFFNDVKPSLDVYPEGTLVILVRGAENG